MEEDFIPTLHMNKWRLAKVICHMSFGFEVGSRECKPLILGCQRPQSYLLYYSNSKIGDLGHKTVQSLLTRPRHSLGKVNHLFLYGGSEAAASIQPVVLCNHWSTWSH